MTENLPAVRTEAPAPVLARDVDSWSEQLPAIVELARSICGTDFVPEAMRDNVAATAAAILYGREVQLPPMTALGNVNVIKGRPGLSAVIMRAQVLAAGHDIRQDESNNALCTLSGRRRGTDYWQTVTYTIDDARQAGHMSNVQYTKNPRRMLRARATSELCELMFADVVRGMPSFEELDELDDDVPAGTPAATARAKVQRKPRTTKTDDGMGPHPTHSGTGSSPAPSSTPMPPLPGEPGYDDMGTASDVGREVLGEARGTASSPPDQAEHSPADAEPGAGAVHHAAPATGPVDEPRMNTRAQQRGLFAVFKELGITDDTERLHITAEIIGRTPMHDGKPSFNGMTYDEAAALTVALATCKTRDHVEALIQMAEQGRADSMGGNDR